MVAEHLPQPAVERPGLDGMAKGLARAVEGGGPFGDGLQRPAGTQQGVAVGEEQGPDLLGAGVESVRRDIADG
ncbi:hypothetical protein AB0K49_12540 [Streptomyces decoyicus]|uniref:hypothetical protein n=1 Tax=Streptomyces decoyicus TaxID=249567 RepID=UPI00345D3D04